MPNKLKTALLSIIIGAVLIPLTVNPAIDIFSEKYALQSGSAIVFPQSLVDSETVAYAPASISENLFNLSLKKPLTYKENTMNEPNSPRGWIEKDGERLFYYNGSPLTGLHTIGGRKYFFNEKGLLRSKVGIDVSVFQDDIDWKKVKADGIDFVIMRAGFRGWGAGKVVQDSKFEEYYKGATEAGLEVGVYFYSQAITVEEAEEEAEFIIELLKTHPITGPVAFDIEGSYTDESRVNDPTITNQDRTDFANAFCLKIREAGYVPHIYTYLSYAYEKLCMEQLTQYRTWIAHYTDGNTASYEYPYQCWQYTSDGKVDGINSGVDMNIRFTLDI